jgi:hypothetical protein
MAGPLSEFSVALDGGSDEWQAAPSSIRVELDFRRQGVAGRFCPEPTALLSTNPFDAGRPLFGGPLGAP